MPVNDSTPNPPPSRGVPATTLILSIALAVTTTAALVLAVLYFLSASRPANGGTPGQPFASAALTGLAPNVQKDAVKPQGLGTGDVFYPVPYAVPPHLTLTAPHRVYRIVKQDEYGFSWAADSLLDDFVGVNNLQEALQGLQNGTVQKKPDIQYEDFTWEAKGVPPGADAEFQRPFEQTGTFRSHVGTEGQENFAIPYASPPQVTLTGQNHSTIMVEATKTGFKWKNGGSDDLPFHNNSMDVTWTATGVRASKLPK